MNTEKSNSTGVPIGRPLSKIAWPMAALALALCWAFSVFAAEKKRLAPDGVNTITDHGNGIQSVTLVHVPQEQKPSEYDRGYAAGVNAALDSIALHDLERQMHATMGTPEQKKAALTPMTWGDRGEIVAKRLGVVRTK